MTWREGEKAPERMRMEYLSTVGKGTLVMLELDDADKTILANIDRRTT